MTDEQIDIDNILELEHAFAEDFGTPVFPMLANHYLKNKEMQRARKVCEIGLQHRPYSSDGKFILAKINLYENKLVKGEQLLKKVVDENPVHINGLRILIEVMRELNRSPLSIKKYLKRILNVLPEDENALLLLNELDPTPKKIIHESPATTKKEEKKKTISQKQETTKNIITEPKKEVFDVGANMATFTMVAVLKAQKNYMQALAVLSRLEEKGADPKRIKNERKVINKLVATE